MSDMNTCVERRWWFQTRTPKHVDLCFTDRSVDYLQAPYGLRFGHFVLALINA
jgi:hypothetical protein